jgi:hypothetical protein
MHFETDVKLGRAEERCFLECFHDGKNDDCKPCGYSKNQSFGGKYRFHFQGNDNLKAYMVSFYEEADQDTFAEATAHQQ